MSFDLIMEKLRRGSLLKQEDYLVQDNDGWTIAHVLAYQKVFPVDFPYWDVKDKDGFSVAHQAAFYKKLPEGFTQWLIIDNQGDSVAHVAARKGVFPLKYQNENNEFYKYTNKEGVSVKEEVKKYNLSQLAKLKTMLKG